MGNLSEGYTEFFYCLCNTFESLKWFENKKLRKLSLRLVFLKGVSFKERARSRNQTCQFVPWIINFYIMPYFLKNNFCTKIRCVPVYDWILTINWVGDSSSYSTGKISLSSFVFFPSNFWCGQITLTFRLGRVWVLITTHIFKEI